jgi:hypothetical protein
MISIGNNPEGRANSAWLSEYLGEVLFYDIVHLVEVKI